MEKDQNVTQRPEGNRLAQGSVATDLQFVKMQRNDPRCVGARFSQRFGRARACAHPSVCLSKAILYSQDCKLRPRRQNSSPPAVFVQPVGLKWFLCFQIGWVKKKKKVSHDTGTHMKCTFQCVYIKLYCQAICAFLHVLPGAASPPQRPS